MEAQEARDRSRRRRTILAGLILAIIATGATYAVLSRPAGPAPEPMESVVVAAHDIAARHELTALDVVVREIPAAVRLEQAFSDPAVVVGQTTGVPIYANQQITPNLFIGTIEDPLEIIPLGEEITEDSPLWRAVSISVPFERAVGGQLRTGDRVDLIATVALTVDTILVPSVDEEGNVVLVPQDANEIGFISPETGEIEGIRSGSTTIVTFTDMTILSADVDANVYVLRADLAQAEALTQMMRAGDDGQATDPFSLALRARADTRTVDTDLLGTTMDRLVERFGFSVPFLLDLDALLGFEVDPIVPVPPSPQPAPEPTPAP